MSSSNVASHHTAPEKPHAVRSAIAVLAAILVFGTTTVAQASTTCLKSRFINHTKVIDPKTVDFRMRDGTVYRNAMRTSCSSLKFSGFVYRSNNSEICDHQLIHILQSREFCRLGTFTKLAPSSVTDK